MCEMCGCGAVKAGPRLASANDVPVMLAAIPVRVVEPSAGGKHPGPRLQQAVKDPLSQRAPRSS